MPTINQEGAKKWRLVCGDFSGIQAFIYRITSKGAAKALRGRSLYIQLLCDAVSEYLLRRLELFPTARIYSSGGKFYLLIADCLESQLRREAERVNEWLLHEFGGDVYLGIGVTQVCGDDFKGGMMSAKWKEANDDLMGDRNSRFSSRMDTDFFEPIKVLDHGAHCEVCGRNDASAKLEEKRCQQCCVLEKLGQNIADADYLFWSWGGDAVQFEQPPLTRINFHGLGCTLYLLKSAPVLSALLNVPESRLEKINATDCLDGNKQGYACIYRWLAKWDRKKRSGKWEFDDFAEKAKGVERLGILRMDVDNLGQLFIRGFRWADKEAKIMGSLSRVATLSRQLNLFFSGHLMQLLADDHQVQIIYAGGDDLFLIGSWDALPDVARRIEQAFGLYAAGNSDFTISGGISMVRGKYPISHAAELAGGAEEKAKELRRQVNGKEREKAAFCMLETAIGWEDFSAVEALRDQLIQSSMHNKAILSRMREVVLAQQQYERIERLRGLDEKSIAELVQWQKWRWQLVYNLHRFCNRNDDMRSQVDAIRKAILSNELPGNGSDLAVIQCLQLPMRWAELLQREAR